VATEIVVHLVGGETLHILSAAPDDELVTKVGSGAGVIEGTLAGEDRRVVIAARMVAYIETPGAPPETGPGGKAI
jgi:hypothetical protein